MNTLSIGSVLSRALTAMAMVFVPFLLMAAIVLGPVVYLCAGWLESAETDQELETALLVILLLPLLLAVIFQGALIGAIFNHLRGKPMGIGESIARGFTTLISVILVTTVTGMLIAGATYYFIIPGLMVSCVLYLVIPVAVIEGAGVADALNRSTYLTREYRWPIFGAWLIIGGLGGAALWGLDRFTDDETISLELMVAAPFAIAALWALFMAACSTVVYVDLRRIKESLGIEDIADLFD